MERIAEEIVKLAESDEVKLETTKPQEVAFAVHKGSYQELGAVFGKLVQRINENGYEIVGPSVTVCYNDPHITPEEELVSECQFPVRKNDDGRTSCRGKRFCQRDVYANYVRIYYVK